MKTALFAVLSYVSQAALGGADKSCIFAEAEGESLLQGRSLKQNFFSDLFALYKKRTVVIMAVVKLWVLGHG